jgi:inorganic pyrophosphatase
MSLRFFLCCSSLGALLLCSGVAFADGDHLWHDLTLEGQVAGTFNAVIEIPKGDHRKFEVDKTTGQLRVDRQIKGQGYPAHYGFIPRTLGRDGDPLDVVVLGGRQPHPGAVTDIRVIGVMKMVDSDEGDDKLIAVSVSSRKFARVHAIEDLPIGVHAALVRFFSTYKIPEGKTVKVGRFLPQASAMRQLLRSARAYQRRFNTASAHR